MNPVTETMITICVAFIASSGFWALITKLVDRKSAEKEMLRGLGHDRITYLGGKYIERGYITKDEYENLYDYLYKPYKALGGNGTAEKIVEECKKLPTHN